MAIHICSKCPIRARYDRNPKSIISRLWRWHIRFCPGWKRYKASLSEEERSELEEKYARPSS